MFEFILCDLQGVERSELPGATNKRFAVPILSVGTAGGQVRLDHPDADALLQCQGLVKVYEVNDDFLVDGDRTLLQVGRLITAEEVAGGGGGSVAFTTADAGWIMARRLIGKIGQVIGGVTMTSAGYSRGDAANPVNRATMITELLAAVNAENPSGLKAGSITSASSTYVAEWRYKPLLEALTELTATLDGPDWRVKPIEPEPTAAAVAYFGELTVASIMGAFQEEAAFELGDGKLNVRSHRRPVSIDATANQVFHLPQSFPDLTTSQVLSADHDASVEANGLLESVVAADLTVDDLRQRLLQHHIDVRHGPRQTITFEPVRDVGDRVPRFGRDFNVGDIVPYRAWVPVPDSELDPTRPARIDVNVRVYQAEVQVDDSGAGTYSLTVTPNG